MSAKTSTQTPREHGVEVGAHIRGEHAVTPSGRCALCRFPVCERGFAHGPVARVRLWPVDPHEATREGGRVTAAADEKRREFWRRVREYPEGWPFPAPAFLGLCAREGCAARLNWGGAVVRIGKQYYCAGCSPWCACLRCGAEVGVGVDVCGPCEEWLRAANQAGAALERMFSAPSGLVPAGFGKRADYGHGRMPLAMRQYLRREAS
ncbi:MAG TPA: hypothetical protein VGA20_09925 [Gemmatimonadales bacterium]